MKLEQNFVDTTESVITGEIYLFDDISRNAYRMRKPDTDIV